jgi:hypothetical protein
MVMVALANSLFGRPGHLLLTPTEILCFPHLKPQQPNNPLNRLLLHRLVLLKVARVVFGITGQDVDYVPTLVRNVQRGDDDGDQVVDH